MKNKPCCFGRVLPFFIHFRCIMIWIRNFRTNVILATKEKAFKWLSAFSTMEQPGGLDLT